ncbi:MAG: TRAP transporter substrate-binding protein [Burkholderiales bacterium]|nr:TRAP transporter substrate-binding protein [Burkholderiales bacterium]
MDPIEFRFGGYQEPASIHNRAAAYFGERLRQRLGDRIRFELIGSVLKLGRASGDLPLMVAGGELDFAYMATIRFTRWVPEFKLFDLPFVVEDRASIQRALMGALGERFKTAMASSPFRLLGVWDNGFRYFSNKLRPIRTPADCKGLRIRIQMSELIAETMAALGFVPVPVDIKEFTENIGGDRFDAQENPLTNIYNFGVHHHHRYITLSGHLFGAAAMICDQARFRAWPPEVQAAVDEAARAATAYQHRLAAAEDDAVRKLLDPAQNEIIELTSAERAAFVAAVQPVLAKHRGSLDPKLFDYLR